MQVMAAVSTTRSMESLSRSPLPAARAAYTGFVVRSNSPEMDKQTLKRSGELIRRDQSQPLLMLENDLEPLERELQAERAAVEEKAALLEQLKEQR